MTDAALVSASIVLSSGMICAAMLKRATTRGQWAELVADEIRVILDAKEEIHQGKLSIRAANDTMTALYVDNHAVLRELLKRETDLTAREQALEAYTFRESA